jgi:hypothetical protein
MPGAASLAMPSGTLPSGGSSAATRASSTAGASAPTTLQTGARAPGGRAQSFTTGATNRATTTVGGRLTPRTPGQTGGAQATGAALSTLLPNNLSGELPDRNSAQIETGTRGGKARLGATGHTMPTCMAAWDAKTHITRARWREICARTLVDPHV